MFGAPKPTEEYREFMQSKVDAALERAEELYKGKPWIGGKKLTIADIQVYTELQNYFLMTRKDWGEYPNLHRMKGKLEEMHEVEQVNAKLYDMMAAMKQKSKL